LLTKQAGLSRSHVECFGPVPGGTTHDGEGNISLTGRWRQGPMVRKAWGPVEKTKQGNKSESGRVITVKGG